MNETTVLPNISPDDRTPYQKWQETEGIAVITGMVVEDLRKIPLKPWKRKGGLGVFINLEGGGSENDSYVCEIPPGGTLLPQKHLYEETIFILEGRGSTTIWNEGGAKQSFEWQAGSLFSPPLNTWHQHFNAQGSKPARYFALTLAPLVINLFHNKEFVFNDTFQFTDRYKGEKDYFGGKGKLYRDPWMKSKFWETNFVHDVVKRDLIEWKERGPGNKSMFFELSEGSVSAHVSEFPVGTYKKGHRHGPGVHVTIIEGEGYSLMWEEGKPIQRYDWKVGSVIVPPDKWFHQHFNVGSEPARYLALHGRGSRKYKSGMKDYRVDMNVYEGGDQIEYEDEDPTIREMFEKDLAKRGAQCQMPKFKK